MSAALNIPVRGLAPIRHGVDHTKPAGPVTMNGVYRNMMAAGFEPKYPVNVEAMDRARQNLDFLDFHRDYNNVVNNHFSDELTSALLNARNSTHLTVIAPMLYTEDINFRMTSADILQIPFDLSGPGNTARVTTYNVRERFASLNMFKRSLRFETTKLHDGTFGAGAFSQGLQSLRTQGEMTLSGMVAYALIDFPYMERIARLTHPTRAFSHMREMLLNEDETAWLNHTDPTALLHRMISTRTTYNKIDLAVVPGGAMTTIAKSAGESRPMPAYQLVLDSALRKYLMVNYDGNTSLTSIPLGDGSVFHITENFAQRISVLDGEEEEIQALRSEITLAEVGMMPVRPKDAPFPLKPNYMDFGMADHQENEVVPRRITLSEAVGNSIIWYNRDGSDADDGNSDHMRDLVKQYNTMANDIIRYFRDPQYADNDRPDPAYLRNGTPLAQMYGFRHFCGFVRLPTTVGGEISLPEFVGDLEPKSLDPMHIVRAAAYLDKLCGVEDFSVNEQDAAKLEKIRRFCKRYLSASLKTLEAIVADQDGVTASEKFYWLVASLVAQSDDYKVRVGVVESDRSYVWGTYADDKRLAFKIDGDSPVAVEREESGSESTLTTKVDSDSADDGSSIKPEATVGAEDVVDPDLKDAKKTVARMPTSESLQQYMKRVNQDTLANATAESHFGKGWAELFAHTTDAGVNHLKEIMYVAQKKPSLNKAELDALHTLTASLADYSLRPHTAAIAERAATMMRNGGNSLTAMVPVSGNYLTTAAEIRYNNQVPGTTRVATAVRAALGLAASGDDDAMDIDEPSAHSTAAFLHKGQLESGDLKKKIKRSEADGLTITVGKDKASEKTGYTWKMFAEGQDRCENDLQRFFYAMIVRAPFTKQTCVDLANAGVELFRVAAFKINIHFLVDSIALTHAGYETMQMALGHCIVLTGVDADAGYLTVNAQFHAGVLCWKPEYMAMIPFAIGNRILGGRNNNPVRSQLEMFADYPGRPSIIFVPLPHNETRYNYPLSLNNEPVYAAPNTEGVAAFRKGSWRDMLNVFAGDYYEGLVNPVSYREGSSFYETSIISQTVHRACTWYYGDSDTMRPFPGTGGLGAVGRNVANAHRGFNGAGRFPTDYENAPIF